jgi:hypothetical protein
MRRKWFLSAVSFVAGLAVLATLGYHLSDIGGFYDLPAISTTSPGIVEVGVLAAGAAGLATVLAGAFSYDSPHPRINLLSTMMSVGIVLQPYYAEYGVLAWTVGALGALVFTANGAAFVVFVEWRRHVRRMKRSRGWGSTGS